METVTDRQERERKALLVLIALTPSLMMGIYIFGASMLILALTCALSAMAFEWALDKAMKREFDMQDYSSMVTGLILAFSCPDRLPLWIAVLGTFVAVVIVKGLLGGFGEKTACPAIAANVLLQLAFRKEMTTFPLNDFVKTASDDPASVTGSTPLGMITEGKELPGLIRMFIGFVSGPCGVISIAAILIGGLYLLWKKVISPEIPAGMIATAFIFALIYYSVTDAETGEDPETALHMAAYHIMAGSLMFAAFFGAGLYGEVIREKFKKTFAAACAVYAAGAGLITMAVRMAGPVEDGAMPAVLIMDILMYLVIRYADSKKNGRTQEK